MFKLFKKKKRYQDDEIAELLQGYELPSFPTAVMNVLSLLRDPDVDMDDVAELIKVDPGMNVRVLRLVNSAAFGLSSKVSNILHAVTLLGKARLEPIVLSLAVKDSIPKPEVNCFDSSEFWRISARRASLARILAHELHPLTETEAFTAGLLQDMAIPMLVEIKKQEYCKVLEQYYESRTATLDELERAAFGFDHQIVGAMVAQKWELPDNLIKSISGHHSGDEVDAAVYIVSFLREYDEVDDNEQLFRVAENEFGIGRDEMKGYIERAFRDAEELIAVLV
ncbi:MAG: HDOD domain-containing protein [Nitrospirae bacterium]|nr:MAG: HDOD domain-containing protein [Nitrospirota bacterium]